MPEREIILLGGGGHCRSCIDVIEESGAFKIAGIVERSGKSKAGSILGYPILGYDNELSMLRKDFDHALVTVGQIESGIVRARLFYGLKKMNFILPVIVSPLAHVSKHAAIGEGTIVMHNALVNAGARVGVNCILNTSSLVEHDAKVGDGTHISTGVVLNGNSTVGSGSFVGSNATIVNGIKLPDDYFLSQEPLSSTKKMEGPWGEFFIVHSHSIFIIAEAGVNHNGSLDRAKQMVKVAARAGADAIKFQTFRAETLVTRDAKKADYQLKVSGAGETQFEMLKRLELSVESHKALIEYCRLNRIEFLSTPFDLTTIDLLVEMGVTKWKIPSGEITNLPYLRKIAALGQEIIISTGMADLGEIGDAIDVFTTFGISKDSITILHCNTEYPTPMQDVNLRAMETIQSAFPGMGVGYSDHTKGIEVSVAAVAMGAAIIEKHFTLDRTLPGPDHRASLEPDELTAMVKAIRNIEVALGSGIKKPSPSELKNRAVVRKSIVAAQPITAGEKFTSANLTVKRPGTGLSPMLWDTVVGKTAVKSYEKDEPIHA